MRTSKGAKLNMDKKHTSPLGFTLLELLVAMCIIGILSAIAIPRYSDYKRRAFDARAQGDLRNAAIAEESYFMEAENYLSCVNNGCRGLPGFVTISKGVTLSMTGSTSGFIGTAKHGHGTGKIFTWDSSEGGMQ